MHIKTQNGARGIGARGLLMGYLDYLTSGVYYENRNCICVQRKIINQLASIKHEFRRCFNRLCGPLRENAFIIVISFGTT
jgi:hypothetical protein